MNKSIIKTVSILSKIGMEKELREILKELANKTREEKGCILFEIYENTNKSGEFILWEHFIDKKALDNHLNKPYTKEYFETNYVDTARTINMETL